MFHSFPFIRTFIIAAGVGCASLYFSNGALAQSTGSAQPSPTPAPYQSPFPSPHTTSPGEEADFAKLQQLQDKLDEAQAAYSAALKCGSDADKDRARADESAASNALLDAVRSFIQNWSDNLYPDKDKGGTALALRGSEYMSINKALSLRSKRNKSTPACPPKTGATTPPETPPPALPSTPPCDDATMAAKVADAESKLASIEAAVDRTERVWRDDMKALDASVVASGPDSVKSQQLRSVAQADYAKLEGLERDRDSLKVTISKMKALKPCPVPNATTPPTTPPPTITAPPLCYDDAAKADLIKSENDLADLNAQIDKTYAAIDDDKKKLELFTSSRGATSVEAKVYGKALEADRAKLNDMLEKLQVLKKHVEALNDLKSCPAPHSTPPSGKSSNDSVLDDVLGHITIGIGVGGGSQNRNRNSGHSNQQSPPNSQPNNEPTTAPQSDSPSPH